MQKMRLTVLFISLLFVFGNLFAQESQLLEDKELMLLGQVEKVLTTKIDDVPNTEVTAVYTTLKVKLLDGEQKDTSIVTEDSSFNVAEGDKVYVRYVITKDGDEYYSIAEIYRLDGLLLLVGIFIGAVLLFGRKQGFLSLVALFISFGVIFKLLFPQMLSGGNIVLIATLGALLALFVVMYVTHGFTRLTTSAFLGCTFSVIATLLFARFAADLTKVTGFSSEESVFLNMATNGNLDFVGLLIGGIIIGVIGVIDDVAITQASIVHELRHTDSSLSPKVLYGKAIKIGRDHMGAVINTLILAYTGASLPLILLLYGSNASFVELINREALTTEIIRSIAGSLGLLLAVPLTTLIAIFLMKNKEYVESSKGSHVHRHHR
jgi:uncharacterized membrane protein